MVRLIPKVNTVGVGASVSGSHLPQLSKEQTLSILNVIRAVCKAIFFTIFSGSR